MLYPLPCVLVGVGDIDKESNLITVAWAGTVCTNPPMLSVSIKPSRYSHHMIEETGEFTVNLASRNMTKALDYCGVRSGKDVDKWKETNLTPLRADNIKAPMVAESPVSIECRVKEKLELGSHDMFVAEVLAVHVSTKYMDEKQRFALEKARPVVYSHGQYFELGNILGKFGYSVKKDK
jgi:flavin reductase (DIM6/NTAB) family NADH-FMN oxidoreductase RutF